MNLKLNNLDGKLNVVLLVLAVLGVVIILMYVNIREIKIETSSLSARIDNKGVGIGKGENQRRWEEKYGLNKLVATRPPGRLSPPGQDSDLRQPGQYLGAVSGVVIKGCQQTCDVQCQINGRDSNAKAVCNQACADYYSGKSDQETRDALYRVHTACRK